MIKLKFKTFRILSKTMAAILETILWKNLSMVQTNRKTLKKSHSIISSRRLTFTAPIVTAWVGVSSRKDRIRKFLRNSGPSQWQKCADRETSVKPAKQLAASSYSVLQMSRDAFGFDICRNQVEPTPSDSATGLRKCRIPSYTEPTLNLEPDRTVPNIINPYISILSSWCVFCHLPCKSWTRSLAVRHSDSKV